MRMHHTLALIASLIMPVAWASDAQAAPWHTVRHADDGFVVEFSDNVSGTPTTGSNYRATQYVQDGGSYAYIVAATVYEVGVSIDFDENVKRAMSVLNCSSIDSEVSPSSSADRNREIHGSKCNQGVRAGVAFFLAGRRFYQVMYLIPNDSDSSDAEHFLHSFKLIAE